MSLIHLLVIYAVVFRATVFLVTSQLAENPEYPCESRVYCHGQLLDKVQRAELFSDSKTFVDMPMKMEEDEVVARFEALLTAHNNSVTTEQLRAFVEEHFHEAGQELEHATLTDFVARPYLYYKIRDLKLRIWANELNILWQDLARQMPGHAENYTYSSLLYVPNPFIVPGGRFREFYYWDTYWIVDGLLVCGMKRTARGIISNLLSMVERFGHVPNGGRVYYTKRSQPPLLTSMVHAYYSKTKDISFLHNNLATLEKEYKFWLHRRSVVVRSPATNESFGLARYRADSNTPRPEGYREDVALAARVARAAERIQCDAEPGTKCEVEPDLIGNVNRTLRNVASACESGWDFSTRWMGDYKTPSSIRTSDIIPVDLNSFLCATERQLSKLFLAAGDNGKSEMYRRSFEVRRNAIHQLLWNESFGAWFDYDMSTTRQRHAFYMSNFLPLFAHCLPDKEQQVERVLKYIQHTNLTSFSGGAPISLARGSGQQWDFPNSWPPNLHMLAIGLADTDVPAAKEMALQLTQNWVGSAYKAWEKHKAMYEKYDAEHPGKRGSGGEYDVQVGFGWTNGAILSLLDRFGNDLQADANRNLFFGLNLEWTVCILVVGLVLLTILTGTLVYLSKRYGWGVSSSVSASNTRYSPVRTTDNHVGSGQAAPDGGDREDRNGAPAKP